MNSVSYPSYSRIFDLSVYAIAAISLVYKDRYSQIKPAFYAIRGFAIASIFDKTIKSFQARNIRQAKDPFPKAIFSAVAEELVYAGILLTQSKNLVLFRFAAALFTSMTASRALMKPASQNSLQGFTLDTKIGFVFALTRELLLYTSASTLMPIVDIGIFALADVCPTKEGVGLPLLSNAWYGKVLTSGVFRFTATTAARTHGIATAILLHLFFNISRLLESKTY